MLELIVVALIVMLDQWTKCLTDLYLMPLGTSVPLWQGVFHFTSAHNRGAAFGMLQGGRWVFLVVTIAACAVIVYFLIRYRKRAHVLLRICLAMILAGAIGNLVDRMWLGYVRDMLDFRLINFAIFNVADSAVTVGVILLAADMLFGKSKGLYDELELEALQRKQKKQDEPASPAQEQDSPPVQAAEAPAEDSHAAP